ncbi:MAG: hypothetical protein LBE51_14965 [Acidovorax sp.]|jgi:hypothetical protein|nr:hypothetical protein [Acidovorax sp.]
MNQNQPLLHKPTKGWEADLPLPTTPHREILSPLGIPPNHIDNIYFELHTSKFKKRGIIIWFGVVALCITLMQAISTINSIIHGKKSLLIAIGLIIIFIGIVISIYAIRTDISPPLDEPIRFNRKRKKIYFYRFQSGDPLSRQGWGITPVVFNWEDLRAEAWSRRAPTTGVPFFTWGVDIAVVAPGTNHVIDRFQLASSRVDGEHMWAMARAFMNQGPEALPKYPNPPRDWNNDIPAYNLARRLAPKVQWPADMDRESRTAP